MKKTDLEKNKALKLTGQLKQAGTPARFGAGAQLLTEQDRREQRKRDQALGLVPFAVKLPQTLANTLRETALERGVGLNELVDSLLTEALRSK
jgi:catechol-2,3-dioxygenase